MFRALGLWLLGVPIWLIIIIIFSSVEEGRGGERSPPFL